MSPEEYSFEAGPIDLAESISNLRTIPVRRGQWKLEKMAKSQTSMMSDPLGFQALTVSIDNPTQQWLFIPPAGRFAPPFLMGARWKLIPGASLAQASWTPPAGGANSANADFGTEAILIFSEDDLPELIGYQLHTI